MKEVTISTDGACVGNPGPGGWACILRSGDRTREMFGSHPHTTNNRMELTAAIEGLRALKQPCKVALYTDSQYLKRGITEWISGWKARGWMRREKGGLKPVLNRDLWTELDRMVHTHHITWGWVKGHATDPDNIRCDELAQRAAREQISSHSSANSC
jgi:ribonuclease HI